MKQSENSRNCTLKRRIDRLHETLKNVDDALFSENEVRDVDLANLLYDAQRLADYLRFVQESKS